MQRAKKATEADPGLLQMSDNVLNLLVIAAVCSGIWVGYQLRSSGLSSQLRRYLDFPGELYMRMLQCMVIPLVSSSIVAALGSIDILLAGHIGLLALLYFAIVTGTDILNSKRAITHIPIAKSRFGDPFVI